GQRLVAYLTAQAEAPAELLEPATLRQALARRLADYMIPSAFMLLEALPLSANGKLDRKALPAPDEAALAARPYEAPQGEAEQVLAQVWQELLGVERVGRHDHFFELGGHSLLVVHLVERLRRQGWNTVIRTVFTSPVLMESALALQRCTGTEDDSIPANLIPEVFADANPVEEFRL
ncbi:phosphopantetheine-binding protein, partial [Duganella sp. Root1480D1]|uniref:phosphopantetheine-binding protein n=1 Tax=Duganella sp. Root1480D1 TaxID=1736471 RepID=UPI000A7325EF